MTRIESFTGSHRFLSNFYPSKIRVDGLDYPTVEHAFQAQKTLDPLTRVSIWEAETPGKAKRMGRKVVLRPDWETVKVRVMGELLAKKFEDKVLRQMLLETGDAVLIEGNTWNDTFWGVCRGKGENWLGRLLMALRKDLVSGKK